MPRPSNTDERRAQITAGLVQVMARRGYDGAAIADVAKAAGLTPGLVHYHFKNKQEILLAALGDLVAALGTFIDLHLGLGADADPEALACWILLGGEAVRDGKVRAAMAGALEGMVARLGRIIREGVEARAFTCEAIDAAASALMATIQGYFVLAATARETIPRGSAAISAKRMAEGLLRPARPLAREARR